MDKRRREEGKKPRNPATQDMERWDIQQKGVQSKTRPLTGCSDPQGATSSHPHAVTTAQLPGAAAILKADDQLPQPAGFALSDFSGPSQIFRSRGSLPRGRGCPGWALLSCFDLAAPEALDRMALHSCRRSAVGRMLEGIGYLFGPVRRKSSYPSRMSCRCQSICSVPSICRRLTQVGA